MEKLKSFLFYLIVIVVILGGGYWAFTSLDSGRELARKDEVSFESEEEEIDLDALAELEEESELEPEPESEPEVDPALEKIKTGLQDLLDRGQVLEPGDSGLLVLRIQKFLNHYDPDLNLSLDQDFGPSTRASIERFQKDQGLNPDGGIGPKTLEAMLDSLD